MLKAAWPAYLPEYTHMALDDSLISKFMDAAEHDQAMALEMLQQYPDLRQAKCLWGESILHYLAIEGLESAVRFLVENGFCVDELNKFEDTALADVVRLDLTNIAKILLKHGANPNHHRDPFPPLLLTAIDQENATMVDLLLTAGAVIEYDNENGF